MKIKLADNVVKSHLMDDKGNAYCSIPVCVNKNLNVEKLYDKLLVIDPELKNYKESLSPYYTIFVKVPLEIELEAKDANPQIQEDVYEITWGLPQNIILSKVPVNSIQKYSSFSK